MLQVHCPPIWQKWAEGTGTCVASLKDGAVQVLIVHGENDRLLPLRNSQRLAALIPHAHLEVFTNCGHSPQEEVPHKLVASVQKFLAATNA